MHFPADTEGIVYATSSTMVPMSKRGGGGGAPTTTTDGNNSYDMLAPGEKRRAATSVGGGGGGARPAAGAVIYDGTYGTASGTSGSDSTYDMGPAPPITGAGVAAVYTAVDKRKAAPNSAPSHPEYVARDGMSANTAMYDVAPTDDLQVVPRPTRMEGGKHSSNQVRAQATNGNKQSTYAGFEDEEV